MKVIKSLKAEAVSYPDWKSVPPNSVVMDKEGDVWIKPTRCVPRADAILNLNGEVLLYSNKDVDVDCYAPFTPAPDPALILDCRGGGEEV